MRRIQLVPSAGTVAGEHSSGANTDHACWNGAATRRTMAAAAGLQPEGTLGNRGGLLMRGEVGAGKGASFPDNASAPSMQLGVINRTGVIVDSQAVRALAVHGERRSHQYIFLAVRSVTAQCGQGLRRTGHMGIALWCMHRSMIPSSTAL